MKPLKGNDTNVGVLANFAEIKQRIERLKDPAKRNRASRSLATLCSLLGIKSPED